MTDSVAVAAVVLAAATLCGCGGGNDAADPASGAAPAATPDDAPTREGEFMQGTLSPGAEPSFRPCERDTELPVRPLDTYVAGLLEEMAATGAPLYAEFLGRPGGRVPGVTLTRLLYAATETPGCDAPEPDYRLRGQGNEPFWSVEVRADTAVWRTPEEIDGVGFTVDELAQVGEGWLLGGSTAAGRTLEASFAATPCRDSMADAWFGFTVEVRIDERDLRGCGRQGRPAR